MPEHEKKRKRKNTIGAPIKFHNQNMDKATIQINFYAERKCER